jgi:zona occludens toxin
LFDEIPPGSVVVLDEVWRRWPSGLKANNARAGDKAFLAEHGHLVDDRGNTTRVVLATQDLGQISAWVRALVEMTYHCTKLSTVGADSRFRVDVYRGAVTGQFPPLHRKLESTFGSYRAEVYQYYQSATKSATGRVGDESRADKRGVIWRTRKFKVMVVSVVVMPLFSVWGLSSAYQGLVGEEEKPAPAKVESKPLNESAPPPRVQEAPPVPDEPGPSKFWRLAGQVWDDDGGLALLASPAGIRTVPMSECEQLRGGVDWVCEVDGELVTAWTGFAGSVSIWSDASHRVARNGRDVPVTRLPD